MSDSFRTLSCHKLLEKKDFTLKELDAMSLGHQHTTAGQSNPPSSTSMSSTIDKTASASSTNHRSGDLILNQSYPSYKDPLSAATQDSVLSPKKMESLGPPGDPNLTLTSYNMNMNSNTDPYPPPVDKSDTFSLNSINAPTSGSGTATEGSVNMQHIHGPSVLDSNKTPGPRRGLKRSQSKLTSSSTPGRKRIQSDVHISDSKDDDADEGPSTPNRKRWRRGKQLVPSEKLWERIGPFQWACKYAGPVEPYGCTAVFSSLRNLGRHMRESHARKEVEMNFPEAERVACNNMPEDLLFNHVTCPYEGEDLEKCGYYRDHNRRWETKTMLRKNKALKNHVEAYHKNKGRPMVIKKDMVSDDENSK